MKLDHERDFWTACFAALVMLGIPAALIWNWFNPPLPKPPRKPLAIKLPTAKQAGDKAGKVVGDVGIGFAKGLGRAIREEFKRPEPNREVE